MGLEEVLLTNSPDTGVVLNWDEFSVGLFGILDAALGKSDILIWLGNSGCINSNTGNG
jgi:hypothetical protein